MGSRKEGDSSLARGRFSLFGLIQPCLLWAWLFPPWYDDHDLMFQLHWLYMFYSILIQLHRSMELPSVTSVVHWAALLVHCSELWEEKMSPILLLHFPWIRKADILFIICKSNLQYLLPAKMQPLSYVTKIILMSCYFNHTLMNELHTLITGCRHKDKHTHKPALAFSSKMIAWINHVLISLEVRSSFFTANILFLLCHDLLAVFPHGERGKHRSSLIQLHGAEGEMKIHRRNLI